jgi:hypothetical protein
MPPDRPATPVEPVFYEKPFYGISPTKIGTFELSRRGDWIITCTRNNVTFYLGQFNGELSTPAAQEVFRAIVKDEVERSNQA